MITHFDHIYSYLKDNDLERTLARYERAGFIINPKKMRHALGRLTGFITLTGTYLEFVSVVDDADFQKNADPINKLLRRAPHPFGIGAVCLDPNLIYDRLSPLYPKIRPPYSRGAADNPSVIQWTFCQLPYESSPGADVFPLKYHNRKASTYEEKKGPNSIFAIGGIYFCSDSPASRADIWTKTLQPITSDFKREGNDISFGCQKLRWLTRERREEFFGDSEWDKRTFLGAEICGVKLLAESLTTARTFLEQADFKVRWSEELRALITTDPNSVFTLVIEEGDSRAFQSSLNGLNSQDT